MCKEWSPSVQSGEVPGRASVQRSRKAVVVLAQFTVFSLFLARGMQKAPGRRLRILRPGARFTLKGLTLESLRKRAPCESIEA